MARAAGVNAAPAPAVPESPTPPRPVPTFDVRDTISEMSWTGGDHAREAEESFHTFLASRKRRRRKLRPLAATGTRRRSRGTGGLIESASLPAATDDDGSLATAGTLRSAVF